MNVGAQRIELVGVAERHVDVLDTALDLGELYSLRTHIHMVAERLVDPAPVLASAE